MKNDTLIIAKKELIRFFTDSRMVVTTILMPGLMIYLIYTLMGGAFRGMFAGDETAVAHISVINPPAAAAPLLEAVPDWQAQLHEISDKDAALEAIKNEETDLLMVFPKNFEADVLAYDVASGTPAPNVEIYFDGTRTDSSTAYDVVLGLLETYETQLSNKFDINAGEDDYNVSSESDIAGMMFSSMLPFLLLIFLFSACMSIVPESIAGEKERGTIATLLVTPMKRGHLVLGKVLALGIIALCSGISSFLGTFLSLPKLVAFSGSDGLSLDLYGISDYLILLFVILSTLFLLVSAISIISSFARSVKESSTAVMPLMIVVMMVGLTSFLGSTHDELIYAFIPVYNSVQTMASVFSMSVSLPNALVTIGSNLVYSSIFVFINTRMFYNEKIIFNN